MAAGDKTFPVTVTDVVLSGLMIGKGAVARMTSADRQRVREVINELGLEKIRNSSLDVLSEDSCSEYFWEGP